MRLAPAVLVLLAAASTASASAQPVVPDTALTGSPHADEGPPQPSAARAYAYSAAATGGAVVLGLLTNEVLRSIDAAAYREDGRYVAGYVVIGTGLVLGPAIGNVSLGAVDDVEAAGRIKVAGIVAGGLIATVGVLTPIATLATGDPGYVETFPTLVTLGLGVATLGTVVGGVMDLSTIPRNARRARQSRSGPPSVAVAPGWRGGPTVALRVDL